MKRLVTLVASVVFALSFAAAQAADAPKGAMKVSNPGGKQGVVSFDHGKHKDMKCDKCHHNEKEGKFKCGECHGKDANAKTKALSFKDAAHSDKGVCYSCHKAPDAANKLACNKCHKK